MSFVIFFFFTSLSLEQEGIIYINFLNKLEDPWLLIFEIEGLDFRKESAYSMSSFELPLECLHLSFSISSFFEFVLLSLWFLEVQINIAHTLNVLFDAIWSFPQVWDFDQHWLHFILPLFPFILKFHLLSSKSILNLQGVNALWGSINFCFFFFFSFYYIILTYGVRF